MRTTGVTARGIVTPIFQQGDDLVTAVTQSVCRAAETEKFPLHDRDIVAVTEAAPRVTMPPASRSPRISVISWAKAPSAFCFPSSAAIASAFCCGR